MIWCAKCSRRHSKTYHAEKAEADSARHRAYIKSLNEKYELSSCVPRPKRPRKQVISTPNEELPSDYESEEYESSDLDGFIVDDEGQDPDARSMLRSITGYDPSSYRDIDREQIEESNATYVLQEEKRSSYLANMEDAAELKKQQLKRIRK